MATCTLGEGAFDARVQSPGFASATRRFALYAAGVVRAKNLVAILIKSFTDTCIAALMFYIIGYGLQVGIRRNDPRPSEGESALTGPLTPVPRPPYQRCLDGQ